MLVKPDIWFSTVIETEQSSQDTNTGREGEIRNKYCKFRLA